MGDRFYDSPDWRFIIATLDNVIITSLSPFDFGRTVTVTMGAPLVLEGQTDAENPKANTVWTDDLPYLWEGVRFIYGLRREDGDLWTVRASTLCMTLEPSADGDWATVRYVGYDPRQLMTKRPWIDAAGLYPGSSGYTYASTSPWTILTEALANQTTYFGNTFIDYDVADPGLDPLDEFTIQQGMTVAEVMEALEATGTIEIFLDPILDTALTPPCLVRLRAQAPPTAPGDPELWVAWDRAGRTADALANLIDGTQRENWVRMHYGQGGDATTVFQEATSPSLYGRYFGELFLPGQTSLAAVELIAQRRMKLLGFGQQTYSVRMAPERGRRPFQDYGLGSWATVGTSRDMLRATYEGIPNRRVDSIQISIDDLGVETVAALVLRNPQGNLD